MDTVFYGIGPFSPTGLRHINIYLDAFLYLPTSPRTRF